MNDKNTLVKSVKFNERLKGATRGDLVPLEGTEGHMRIIGENLNKKALEMHRAVIALLRADPPMAGAAGALIRPMFECHLRGLWWIKCALGEISDPDENHNMRNIKAFVSPPLERAGQNPTQVEAGEQRNVLSRKDCRDAWAWQTILAKLKKNDPDKGFMKTYLRPPCPQTSGLRRRTDRLCCRGLPPRLVHGGHLQAQTGIRMVKGTPRAMGHYTEGLRTSFRKMADHIAWLSAMAMARAHTDPNAREEVARIGKGYLAS